MSLSLSPGTDVCHFRIVPMSVSFSPGSLPMSVSFSPGTDVCHFPRSQCLSFPLKAIEIGESDKDGDK